MALSIGEVAQQYDLSIPTLRYYEEQGLLPFIKRSPAGRREFRQADLDCLCDIECLKKTGMQLKDIKQYIDWRTAGDETLDQRLALIQQRRQMWASEIESLQAELTKLDHKEWYYTKASEAGTEAIFTAGCDTEYERAHQNK